MTMEKHGGGDRWGRLLRMAAWGGAGLLFLLPVAAEQLTEEMAWSANDFVLWGATLLAALAAFEVSMRMSSNWAYRAGAAIAIGAAFLLVWINLAVGIIGSEDNNANLMYAGVLGFGVLGAVIAGFGARGMARTLFIMAVGQVLIAVITLVAGWGAGSENWPQVIVFLNGFFATAWLISGGLFRKAAQEQTRTGAAP